MGASPSRSQLQRSKSFTTFGRSSQRGLFQKSKGKLKQIEKKLHKLEEAADTTTQNEIKQQLEEVEKELNAVSAAIKVKNQSRYDEVLKQLKDARDIYESKFPPAQENAEEVQVPQNPENVRQTVELTLVKVVAPVEEEEDVEIRRPLVEATEEELAERHSRESENPPVKFGVQVMPTYPRISQQLLKRRTLPENEGPKAEFEKIRVVSDSAAMSFSSKFQHKPTSKFYVTDNEFYNLHLSSKMAQEVGPPSPVTQNGMVLNPIQEELPPRKPPRVVEKTPMQLNALQQLESLGQHVDELERKLKFFNGKKEDDTYLELHESFIKCIIKLDDIDTLGDPVVKQERKIAIQRVQELMAILERLVEVEDSVDCDEENDIVETLKKVDINLDGKPVTTTAL